MWVQSLGWENTLEAGLATHSSTVAWRIPRTEKPDGLQPIVSQTVRHDWSNLTCTHRTVKSIKTESRTTVTRGWKRDNTKSLFNGFSSVAESCLTLCNPMNWSTLQASVSITSSRSLLKLMFIESVMPSNHLILCHPLLLLPSIFPNIRVFSNESALCIRWPKYWSFSFSISPSNEHPGLISFRMDCLDLLAVQGTLRSLLQHHSSQASILWCSAFFLVQLSDPYTTTGKKPKLWLDKPLLAN